MWLDDHALRFNLRLSSQRADDQLELFDVVVGWNAVMQQFSPVRLYSRLDGSGGSVSSSSISVVRFRTVSWCVMMHSLPPVRSSSASFTLLDDDITELIFCGENRPSPSNIRRTYLRDLFGETGSKITFQLADRRHITHATE